MPNLNFNMTIDLTGEDIKLAVTSLSLFNKKTDMRGETYGHELKGAHIPVRKLGSYQDR